MAGLGSFPLNHVQVKECAAALVASCW